MAKKKMNPLDKVAARFNITVREARDIATAVGTAAQSVRNPNYLGARFGDGDRARPTAKSIIKKQVKETVRAAKTGKKGTSSPQLKDTGKKVKAGGGQTMPKFKYKAGKSRTPKRFP
jgi:tRNA(Glu) U13 pseudouridine synthase TruD